MPESDVELVSLPSGAVAPLVPPSLDVFAACGGGLEGLARAVFAHEEVEIERLSTEDLYAVAEWAVVAFVETPAAVMLGQLGSYYSTPPSKRLGVSDRLLAIVLDAGCMERASSVQDATSDEPGDEDGRVVIMTGGEG